MIIEQSRHRESMSLDQKRSSQTKSLSAVGLLIFSLFVHQVLGASNSTAKNSTSPAPNVKTYQSYNNVVNPLGDAGFKYNGAASSESVKSSDNRQTVQPMISPRYRYKFQPSVEDSYLNALKHSHTIIIKDPRDYVKTWPKITRREHAPSPVYRADSNNTGGVKIKSVTREAEPAVSKVSQSNGPYYIQQSEEIPYGLPHVTISEFQPYDTYSSPDKSYGTPPKASYSLPLKSHYGAPKKTYGEPPAPVYGEPSLSTSYGLPPTSSFGESPSISTSYGVPLSSSYGTPSSFSSSTNSGISSYVVPSHQGLGSLTASYSTSYPLPDLFPLTFLPGFDFSWPISLKINAYTLLKIVLKIVVFKMVVKFIAAICLLLFIPKLIPKKDDDEDDKSRKFGDAPTLSKEKLWMLSSTVTSSIDHYRNENEKLRRSKGEEKEKANCTSLDCQSTKKLLATGDTWTDYKELFKLYLAEEAQVARKDNASRMKRRRRRK
ncbi:hypothetical protein TKK_0006155 [Trichogramma kaykai]|uniref:Uncharacterized protein n=1 Tax=Trichogramma kaykai TaxID=54128 RepID=A0ABD2XF37_9HYME